jgi:hypothetical protein
MVSAEKGQIDNGAKGDILCGLFPKYPWSDDV